MSCLLSVFIASRRLAVHFVSKLLDHSLLSEQCLQFTARVMALCQGALQSEGVRTLEGEKVVQQMNL